jgi:hypothetical protein
LVNVTAYGVPAVLIVLGFFAYLSGYAMNALTQDAGLMNGGILMIVIGVLLCAIELIVKMASRNS